jgi:hypothetical protein
MDKRPACPKFGMQMRLCLNGNQIWMEGIRAPESTTRIGFWSPPAFLPLSRRGGSRIEGAPLQRLQSEIPDQWHARCFWTPLAFLPLSGGGGSRIEDTSLRRLRLEHPGQQRIGNPNILCLSVFNQHGPLSCRVIFCAIFPLVICSPPSCVMRLIPFSPSSSSDICPPPLFWSMWSLPPSHHSLTICHVSRSLPRHP